MHFGLDEAAIDGGDAIERMGLAFAEIGAPLAGEGDEGRKPEGDGAEQSTDESPRAQRRPLAGGRRPRLK